MQDNRWLYFIVGGLAVVALVFFGFFYDPDGTSQEEAPQTQATQPASPGPGPVGSAAGESDRTGAAAPTEEKRD